ncbi:hypothetical protein NM688_g6480 [Phlebia brevispora]|uniref:Uncharacterized protein n=1 Tax=Phlebia brevispora TaxID=194682 RepID=A0ACC1SFS2_9APHY|nr:hypothetical protein NM688_g6480 [Phlebia brevispora]
MAVGDKWQKRSHSRISSGERYASRLLKFVFSARLAAVTPTPTPPVLTSQYLEPGHGGSSSNAQKKSESWDHPENRAGSQPPFDRLYSPSPLGDGPASGASTPRNHYKSSGHKPSPMAKAFTTESRGLWNDFKSLRWAIVPCALKYTFSPTPIHSDTFHDSRSASALKMLMIPVVLWANWELLRPVIGKELPNPFTPLIFISHRVPTSSPEDPRYQKGYGDLLFIVYYIVVWSFVRQAITLYICRPLARASGIRKEAKIDRFGEQAYAVIYFGFNGVWGLHIMSQLPTWWYQTKYYWIDYPHWQMVPGLKRYYLMQCAYWCQQLLVLVLGLEKPRKDYSELVAHHIVTLWLVGWSYLINLTLIGNAIYVSMDIPDMFLAVSKLFNYMQWKRTKVVSFVIFVPIWIYFRHYLNFRILWSCLYEFHLMPEYAKEWSPKDGWWMVWWMQYQVFAPILLLQFIQLFWLFLIFRIAYRALFQTGVDTGDERSDEEDGPDDEIEPKEE